MTAIFWTRGRSFPFCDLKNQTQNAYDQNTDLDQIRVCNHKHHLPSGSVANRLPLLQYPSGPLWDKIILSEGPLSVNSCRPVRRLFLMPAPPARRPLCQPGCQPQRRLKRLLVREGGGQLLTVTASKPTHLLGLLMVSQGASSGAWACLR